MRTAGGSNHQRGRGECRHAQYFMEYFSTAQSRWMEGWWLTAIIPLVQTGLTPLYTDSTIRSYTPSYRWFKQVWHNFIQTVQTSLTQRHTDRSDTTSYRRFKQVSHHFMPLVQTGLAPLHTECTNQSYTPSYRWFKQVWHHFIQAEFLTGSSQVEIGVMKSRSSKMNNYYDL